MAEYIEREAFIKHLRKDPLFKLVERYGITHAIESFPSADVAPVRHGRWGYRWICSNMTGYEFACSCSECGKPTYRISTLEPMPLYCPNCGAKMDTEEREVAYDPDKFFGRK